MIVEGLVTSIGLDGRLNVAPMGPIVEGDFEQLVLRPFQPSTTFSNLSSQRCGVFHVTDDVDVISRAVTGTLTELPATESARVVAGQVLLDCCRWYEFEVEDVEASEARSRMPSRVVHRGERRGFLGFNRARHAVLEAAILATRLHLLPAEEIDQALRFLAPSVTKTGGPVEQDAWERILEFIQRRRGLLS